MSTFPNFSNIEGYVQETLNSRINNPLGVSNLNAWIRVISGVSGPKGDGLVLYSNPDLKLFNAAGDSSATTIYGNKDISGIIGVNWNGSSVSPSSGVGLRPSPIVESISIDEGAGNLSRKAEFSVKCFSKEQMEIASNYFLEPGFSIFLEWGWNDARSSRGLVKRNASEIASHQNFKNLKDRREKTVGTYDNYLGYITGGSVAVDGEIWTLNVKCTGFTELPAYLVNGDNSGNKRDSKSGKATDKKPKSPDYKNLSAEADLNKKRWMFAFNALPSNRKTLEIRALGDKNELDNSIQIVPVAHAVNFINFDETITDTLNSKGDGNMISRFFKFGGATQDGERTELPAGTEIVGTEKFIRFGTLIKIFNTIILKGLKIGNEEVKMVIDSSNTVCSAYTNIFSTRKDKLFIPNNKTPKFSLTDAKNSTQPLETIPAESTDNSVSYENFTIQFPSDKRISSGIVEGGDNLCFADGDTTRNMGITKSARQWGFLDDLYVNFDFASEILSTSNLTVKDALYQILNGMSSAVNDLWNFQIVETSAPENNKWGVPKGATILSIVDLGFTYKDEGAPPYEFNLIGTHSIFKDASLSLDISGAKMNQIIGTRLSTTINTETSPNLGVIFAPGLTDLILADINSKKEETVDDSGDSGGEETDEELKEKNYADFLGKLGTYPKVELEKADIDNGFDVNKVTYVSTYDDAQLLKLAREEKEDEVSILMPINFSFTIHGVSGIKRGDKFKVKGIPDKYYNQGFFQVLGVKHTIQNMEWITEVEGGYRNNL